MCASAPKPPTPVAPPAPTPVRDEKMGARANTQSRAQRGAASGYASTLLTKPGESSGSGGTSAKLGG